MTGSLRDELRIIAERAATSVQDALIHHADVMATPGVRYSAVADADDRVIDALNTYRESAEEITGLSVLLRLPVPDITPEEHVEILNGSEDVTNLVADEVVLKARWYFDITDPRLVVAAASKEESTTGSREIEVGPEGEEVNTGELQWALAALFERNVLWPPPEYAEIGLIATGMYVAVYVQDHEGE